MDSKGSVWYPGKSVIEPRSGPDDDIALIKAVCKDDSQGMRTLIRRGANVNARNALGWTPLHKAALLASASMARDLILFGAEVDAQNDMLVTPLHIAAMRNRQEIVLLLTEYGADVDAQDYKGRTPLHGAAVHDSCDIVKLLLAEGAGIDAPNQEGETPLHVAVCHHSHGVVGTLLKYGANISLLPRDQRRKCRYMLQDRILFRQEASHGIALFHASRSHHVTQYTPPVASADIGVKRSQHTQRLSSRALQSIREQLANLPDIIPHVTVEVETELAHFIEQEMDKSSDLSSTLTFSGHNQCGYATICSSYIKEYWSDEGLDLLHLIENSIGDLKADCYFDTSSTGLGRLPISFITSKIGHLTYINVEVENISKEDLTHHMHLLSWISAQFRVLDQTDFFYSSVEVAAQSPSAYSISLCPLQPVPIDERLCWNDMIGSAIIAKEFPIPERYNEIGLELPFDFMISLAGILYPFQYHGGIVLKGYSTVLIPTAKPSENSLQWHFKSVKDSNQSLQPISMDRLIGTSMNKFKMSDIDQACQCRAFLGVWPSVEILLGTRDSMYNGFKPSDESKETGSWGIDHEHQFNLGLSKLISVQGSFKVRRRQALYVQDNSPHFSFEDLLKRSARHPLLLYDTKATHAWLVPELSFILHLAILELKHGNARSPEKAMPYADPASHGGYAALAAIVKAGDTDPDLERIIRRLFTAFTERRDAVIQRDMETSMSASSSDLLGWDVDDLRFPKYVSARRKTPMDKSATGGWYRTLRSHPDILIIFSKDLSSTLGYPFKPHFDRTSCHWNSFLHERYLMLAPVKCLDTLRYQESETATDMTYRLSKKQYLVASSRFCSCESTDCGNILLHISEKGTPKILNSPNGAVLIGKPSRLSATHDRPVEDFLLQRHDNTSHITLPNRPEATFDHRFSSSDFTQVDLGAHRSSPAPAPVLEPSQVYPTSRTHLKTPGSYDSVETESSTTPMNSLISRKPAFIDLRTRLQYWPDGGGFYTLPNDHIGNRR